LKVLFLSQRVPYPPDRGDRITTYHFLSHLVDRGAEVRVGCLAEEDRDEASVAALREIVTEVCAPRIRRPLRKLTSLRSLLTGASMTTTFFRHRALQRTVDRWVREHAPDLVHVYSSSMAQYVLHHDAPFRLMQFAELDSDKWRQYAEHSRGPARFIYRREAERLLAFETEVARRFDVSTVVSDVEKELFERLIPGITPVVLPNGVDVDAFRCASEADRDPHAVIFTGVMDYDPNVQGVAWFVRRCRPGIRARVPTATLRIVGSRPTEAVRRLGGRDGIEVTGRVEAIPPWFDRSAVAIAPLKLARGVQNKVLEAMSTALPVVASPQAVQGLGDVGEEALMVAADADSTIAAVAGLLEDPERARRMGAAAAEFVRERFRWEHMFAILDEILAPLSAGETRSAP
jgi:sugar transferase (PEP-CTERM/EpsH1 system associated)